MSPRILLLRHGRSLANEQGLIASSLANAGDAFGLTPAGRDQVSENVTDAQAAGRLVTPVRLISSPLLRARESAEVAANLLGASVTIDARLSERGFGDFELEPDERYEEVWREDRLDPAHRCWGVESVVDLVGRVGPLVREITGNDAGGCVVLCTHGDVASVLLCAWSNTALGLHREVGAMGTGTLRELPTRPG